MRGLQFELYKEKYDETKIVLWNLGTFGWIDARIGFGCARRAQAYNSRTKFGEPWHQPLFSAAGRLRNRGRIGPAEPPSARSDGDVL